MYQQIKQLANEALALQNKDHMDAVLCEISALCDQAATPAPTEPVKAAGKLKGSAQ